jgi:hypothetical protein
LPFTLISSYRMRMQSVHQFYASASPANMC